MERNRSDENNKMEEGGRRTSCLPKKEQGRGTRMIKPRQNGCNAGVNSHGRL